MTRLWAVFPIIDLFCSFWLPVRILFLHASWIQTLRSGTVKGSVQPKLTLTPPFVVLHTPSWIETVSRFPLGGQTTNSFYSCRIYNQQIFLVQAKPNFINTPCLLGVCRFFATKLQQLLNTYRNVEHGLREMERLPIGSCQAEQLADITAPIIVRLAARIYLSLSKKSSGNTYQRVQLNNNVNNVFFRVIFLKKTKISHSNISFRFRFLLKCLFIYK